MVASVVAGVESGEPADTAAAMRMQLLGALSVFRAGVSLPLPASRKTRALLAYLTLAPRPVPRTRLCDLLGDETSDPRGELRWCLSKIRALLDEPGSTRVRSASDAIGLDLGTCAVDALAVSAAMHAGLGQLTPQRLQELSGAFGGEFLAGLELDRSPQLNAWLVAQRRRFNAWHVAILEKRVGALSIESPDVFVALDKWLELAPLDRQAHETLLNALAIQGRLREGEAHLAATARLFETEGLDSAPLRRAWQNSVQSQRGPRVQMPDERIARPATGVDVSPRRASIAVMPLTELSDASETRISLAGPLAHDVITRLAKLRSVAVIAQGTVYALSERGMGAEAAGRMLNVDYVASGSIRRDRSRFVVMMELAETRTARIIWAEDYDYSLDDALLVLDQIGNRIVAALAGEIETAERNRALLKPPNSLDAWEALHRGLWHMYRFNAADNDQAQHFFQQAVRLDPAFSRAHAALSFTHFQNAFLHRIADRNVAVGHALASAEQSVIADERDPAAHLAMGRALWLRGEQDGALAELDQAVALSPNFALGHYSLAFVHSQSGDPRAAIESADTSRELSPFDPLLFGMLASRALGLVRLGRFDEAADSALKAAGRPTAHVHIRAIAAHCLAAASRLDEARAMLAQVHRTHAHYGVDDYFKAFRFTGEDAQKVRTSLRRIGLR